MRFLRLSFIFSLAVLGHARSLSYWFTSVDTVTHIETSRVGSPDGVIRVVSSPMLSGSRFTDIASFYRPVSSLSYALDYTLWGLWPGGYHLTNVLLHGTVAVLAALAISEVTRRPLVGDLTAGLFALHPLTIEVVPTAARRHDIIMAVFLLASLVLFIRGWRQKSPSLLLGSVIAYALALGAKEPALMFPGVIVAWVALNRTNRSLRERSRASVTAAIPFAAVTIVYLGVRIGVLGGIGGYEDNGAMSLSDVGTRIVKYALSLTYHSDVIGVWLAPKGWPLAIAVVVFLVPLALLWRAGRTCADCDHLDHLMFVIAVAGFGAVSLLSAIWPRVEWSILVLPDYHHPVSASIGAAYTGGCLAVVLGSVRIRRRLSSTDRISLSLFAIWLTLPLALFLTAEEYTIRGGYLSIVPAMATVALLLVVGGRGIAGHIDRVGGKGGRRPAPEGVAANAALVGALVLLLLPLLLTSPLAQPYDGWRMSGEVNKVTLQAVQDEVDAAEIETVRIVGFASGVELQRHRFPRTKSINYLGPGTVEAWLRLQGEGDVTVIIEHQEPLPTAPTDAKTEASIDGEVVVLHITYAYESDDSNRVAAVLRR